MFHDFCQSVTLAFCQKTHVSHDHHPRGQCCSSASISYDAPCMGAISYQKIFASALTLHHLGIGVLRHEELADAAEPRALDAVLDEGRQVTVRSLALAGRGDRIGGIVPGN